jgi:hypothetical protein
MGENSLPAYKYGGARAMVQLHEHYMREFLETWVKAKEASLVLPKTDDPAYASLETLLRHICSAARGYMVWMCEVLSLPDPEITAAPEPEAVEEEAEAYIEHILVRWREPLANVEEERFHRPEYPARWKTNYCIDAMMEHAVMHPLRHEFQLRRLMGKAG